MADLLEILLRMSGDSGGAREALAQTSAAMKKTEGDAGTLGGAIRAAAEGITGALSLIASAAQRVGSAGFSLLKTGAETAARGVQGAASLVVESLHGIETATTSVAGGIIGKIVDISKNVVGMALVAASTAEAFSLHMRTIDRVLGTIEGRFLDLGHGATQAASAIGRAFGHIEELIRPILQESEATKEFEANFQKLLLALGSPLINGLIEAMRQVNLVFADPAVKQFITQISSIFTVAMQAALRALDAFLAGFQKFADAFTHADLLGAIQALGKGIENAFDALTGGAFSWGVNLITSFANGIIQGAASAVSAALNYVGSLVGDFLESHSPPKRGPLANIDVWGINLITTYAKGFTHADFSTLDEVGNVIKAKLDAVAAEAGGNVTANKVGVIRQLIGSQGDVAAAIADLTRTGTLSEQTVQRLRAALASLGPAVQDYAEASLRALAVQKEIDAETKVLEAAQDDLRGKQEELAKGEETLNALQHEQELLRRAQEDRAATLKGLEDQIVDDEQKVSDLKQAQLAADQQLVPLEEARNAAQIELDKIELAQTERRKQLRDLTEQQADAELQVTNLERQQADALAALVPLKDAITVATKAEHEAEQAVKDAQQDLIPLQNQIADMQTAYQAQQTEFNTEEQAVADQRQALQDELNGKLDAENAALTTILRADDAQIAVQQKIIDGVEARWKDEEDGARAALAAAETLWAAEDARNSQRLIQFDKQREAANLLSDPNLRLQGLARIQAAEQQYQERAAPTLDRLDREKKLREDNLKTIEDQKAAEEKAAADMIAALRQEEDAAKKTTQDRVQALHDEYDTRIKMLQQEEDSLKRQHQQILAAAKAQIDAAQADLAARERVIQQLQVQKDAATQNRQNAEDALAAAEQEVHDRTDGALNEAKTRAQALKDQADALDRQLQKERQGAQDRLDDASTEYQIRKDINDTLYKQQTEAAQQQLDADRERLSQAQQDQQRLADAENHQLELRMRGAQDVVYNEQQSEKAARDVVKAEQDKLDLLDKQKKVYDDQAQAAKDLVDLESKLASELSQAQGNEPKGKKEKPGPPAIPDLPDPQKALKPWTDALAKFSAEVHAILDPLGAFFDDIFHGRFLAAQGDLDRFGTAAGAAIGRAFGPQTLETIRKVTDPLGKVADTVLKLGDALSKGEDPIQAFRDILGQIVPAPLAVALGDLWKDISHFVETIGPNLLKLWDNLQPGIAKILPVASKLGEIFGIVLYGGIKLVIGVLQWISDNLPVIGTVWSGLMDALDKGLGAVTKAIQPLLDAFGQNGLQGVLDALNDKSPTTNKGFELIRNVFQTIKPIAEGVGTALDTIGKALGTAYNAVKPLLDAFGQNGLQGVFDRLHQVGPESNTDFDKLKTFLQGVGDAAGKAWDFLGKVVDLIKNVGPILAFGGAIGVAAGWVGGIVTAVGDLVAVISLGAGGGLFGILSALVAGGGPLATLAIVLGSILSPVGLIVIAITGLAALFVAWAGGIDGIVTRAKAFFSVLQGGGSPLDAFKVALSGMIPPDVIKAIGQIVAAFQGGLQVVITKFQTDLLPKLQKAWDNLQPGLRALGGILHDFVLPALGALAALVGGVVVIAIGAVIDILGGLMEAVGPGLEGFATLITGVFETVYNILKFVFDFIGTVVKIVGDLLSGNLDQAEKDATAGLSAMVADVIGIGKGLLDALSGIWNGILGFIAGFGQGLWDTLVGMWQAISDTLIGHSIIPDLINGIIGFFQGLPGQVLAFIQGLWDGAVNLFNAGAELVKSIVVAFITDRVNEAKQFAIDFVLHIIELKDQFISNINILIDTVKTAVVNFITDRVNDAKNFAINFIVHIIELKDNAILWFNTMIDTVKTAVVNFITDRVNDAKNFAINFIVHIIELKDNAILWFNTMIDTVKTAVVNFITDRVNDAKQFAIDFIVHIIKLKDDAIAGFNLMVSTVKTAVTTFISDIVAAAKQFAIDFIVHILQLKDDAIAKFNELKDAVIGPNGIIQGLISGILGAIGNVVDSLTGQKGLFQTMLDKAHGEIQKWIDFGTNIVGGIIQGIQQKAADLWAALTSLGQQAPQEAAKATESHSPSKVMIPAGESLVEGMGVGVETATPGLLDKISDAGKQAAGTMAGAMTGVRTAFAAVFGGGDNGGGTPPGGPQANAAPAGGGGGATAGGGTLLDAISAFGSALPGAVQSALAGLPQPIQDALNKVWAVFKNNFWPHPQEVEDKSHNIIFLFLDPSENGFFTHLTSIVVTFMETLWFNTWKGELDKLVIRLSEYLTNTKDTVYEAMKSLGVQMDQGFIAGMDSMLQDVINKAKAIVDAAIKAAQEAAGNPHSPAPAFVPLGRTWGEGLDSGFGSVEGVIRGTARRLIGVAQAALNAPGVNGLGLRPGPALNFATATVGLAGGTAGTVYHDGRTVNIGAQYNNYRGPDTDLATQEFYTLLAR